MADRDLQYLHGCPPCLRRADDYLDGDGHLQHSKTLYREVLRLRARIDQLQTDLKRERARRRRPERERKPDTSFSSAVPIEPTPRPSIFSSPASPGETLYRANTKGFR